MNKDNQHEKMTAEEAENILAETFGGDSVLGLYEKKIMKLRNLLEVSKIINATLEEDKLLQTILYSCQGQFLIATSSIFLLEDFDGEKIIHKVSIGMFEDEHEELTYTKSDELAEYFKHGTNKDINSTYRIDEMLKDPALKKYEEDFEKLGCQLAFPIKGKKDFYGFLFIGTRLDGQKFENEDIANIKVFTELASISIENVGLFDAAIKDRMTKLYNHQWFQNTLYTEIEKSKKTGNSLCLIMFDIDHFKVFNDTYGHQQGDVVLKLVAEIIKKSVRTKDFAARYGGEEFAVICPNSGYDDAVKTAEKLRSSIYNTEFPGQQSALYVTISLGICKFDPEKMSSKAEFVELTDQALYLSKNQGRNQWNISLDVPASAEIPQNSGTSEAGTKAYIQYITNLKKIEEAEKGGK